MKYRLDIGDLVLPDVAIELHDLSLEAEFTSGEFLEIYRELPGILVALLDKLEETACKVTPNSESQPTAPQQS